MNEKKVLSGSVLAGTSLTRDRAENDFYATPENAIKAILEREYLFNRVLEPACGDGAICRAIKQIYPNIEIEARDIVDRGYPDTIIDDFITSTNPKRFDTVITNPPFSLAQEFIEKALQLAKHKVIIFAKIQLLEGEKRRKLFDKYPPARIYVFSKRVSPLNNGSEFDENGKKWATTMCFAWFVWEQGFCGAPQIYWF